MEDAEIVSEAVDDIAESTIDESEDKHDNDSGIQNDVKDEEDEKNEKEHDEIDKLKQKKKKESSPSKSPKKSKSRSSSPTKNPKSPIKSPKKRKRKIFPKPEKDDEKTKEQKERFNETLLVDNDGLNQDQDASKGKVLAYLANWNNEISYSSFPGGVEQIAKEAE